MAARPASIPQAATLTFDRPARVRAALVAALFVATFWHLLAFIPPLGLLVHAWIYEADWSHGPLIPLFAAYLVYVKWERVRRCPVRHTWVGLVVLLLGLSVYLWSLARMLPFGYVRPLAMMTTLLGLIVFLCGLPLLYYVWLPWLYLFFAIPLPQRLYFAWTNPLRRIAAGAASAVLGLVPDLNIERVGSNIEYFYRGASGVIGIADACSGMRSTVTLCALGVAVACLSDRPLWQRIVLVAACVPIATFCNIIRVTTTCWLHIFVDPKYASGQYHMMFGLVVILLAFGIFSALGWLLSHLWVEEPAANADGDESCRPAERGPSES
jgi:exosortase